MPARGIRSSESWRGLRRELADDANVQGRSDRTRDRAALISAVFHAHQQPGLHDGVPYMLAPLSWPALERYLRSPTADPEVRRHALAWLIDSPHDALHAEVERLLTDAERAALTAADHQNAPSSTRWEAPVGELEAEQSRFAVAHEALSLSNCRARNLRVSVRLDPDTLITYVEVKIDVDQPASGFGSMADPRNWQNNAPLFFEESVLVKHEGAGQFGPVSPEPAPLTSYDQLLHELVTLSWNEAFPMRGSNVLRVDYTHQAAPVRAGQSQCGSDISLFSCLWTQIGASFEHGGLDVDGGSFHARVLKKDGPTELSGSKQVRFTERELCGIQLGRWLNLFAPFWLGPWMTLLITASACTQTEGNDP